MLCWGSDKRGGWGIIPPPTSRMVVQFFWLGYTGPSGHSMGGGGWGLPAPPFLPPPPFPRSILAMPLTVITPLPSPPVAVTRAAHTPPPPLTGYDLLMAWVGRRRHGYISNTDLGSLTEYLARSPWTHALGRHW